MRVLLISANTETINMPVLPLGLGCVAATLQGAGFNVRLLNLQDQTDLAMAGRNREQMDGTSTELDRLNLLK